MVANALVRILLTLAAILGFLPASNPFGEVNNLKFRLCSIFTALSLLQLAYPMVYISDTLVNAATSAAKSTLTARFMQFTVLPAAFFCSTIIRFSALCNCSRTLRLITTLLSMKAQVKHAGFGKFKKGNWSQRLFMFACLVWIIFFPIRQLFVLAIEGSDTGSYGDLGTMPEAEWARQLLAYLAEISVHTAPAFAMTFTVTCGIWLLDLEDSLRQILLADQSATKKAYGNPSKGTLMVKAVGMAEPMRDGGYGVQTNFGRQFADLKNLFADYEAITGWYVFAIIINVTTGLTKALSFTAFRTASFTKNADSITECTSALFLLSFFGQFMKDAVRRTF